MEEDLEQERTKRLLQEPKWMILVSRIIEEQPEVLNQMQIVA